MDFDDLDNEEAAATPTPKVVLDEYMTPMPRNYRIPSLKDAVPEKILDNLPKDPDRKVTLRVFTFIGAGDTVVAWASNMIGAPSWLEMAVHEWPSHGTREEENCPPTLEKMTDDAFRAIKPVLLQHQKQGRFVNAPFAFIGHSVGALIVVTLSKRVKEELGLEPAALVILDRAPPHMPLFNSYGQELKKTDPDKFLIDYVSNIVKIADTHGGEKGARMKRMWHNDITLAVDTREVGFYKFNCDILVLRGAKNQEFDFFKKSGMLADNPEQLDAWERRAKIMFSSPESSMDFDWVQFEEWSEWTSKELTITDVDAGHNGIFGLQAAQDLVYDFLSKVAAEVKTK